MTQNQMIHVGMINSYNILMGKANIDEVLDSGLNFIAYPLDEELRVEYIDFMVIYFESIEMFEHCADLTAFVKKNFGADGTLKEKECRCNLPQITEYSPLMYCGKCKKRLKQ